MLQFPKTIKGCLAATLDFIKWKIPDSNRSPLAIQAFVERNIQQMQDDFDQLDSAERLRILERFMQYLLPRYASQPVEPINYNLLEPLVIVLTKDSEDDAVNLTHPI